MTIISPTEMRSEGLGMSKLKLFLLFQCLSYCTAELYDLVTDKPTLTHVDRVIFPFVNVTASRFGRRNTVYYTTLHVEVAVPLDDNYTFEVVFYENVNNQFRRSFIELHYKWCSFLFKDLLFGAAIRRQISFDRCPVPPATYHLHNMTAAAEHLPRLPFSKGRVYVNLKLKSKFVASGYCDIELKKKKPVKH